LTLGELWPCSLLNREMHDVTDMPHTLTANFELCCFLSVCIYVMLSGV